MTYTKNVVKWFCRVQRRGVKLLVGLAVASVVIIGASGGAFAGSTPPKPSLTAPTVVMPSTPSIPSSATTVPVVPAAGGSPTGTSQFDKAWQQAEKAQAKAEQTTATTLPSTTNYPDPCGEVMMQAMATGKASPAVPGCSGAQAAACNAAGLALHSQMQGLSDPQSDTTTAGEMPTSSWQAMPAWQQQIVLQQNPVLQAALNQSPTASSGTPLGSLNPNSGSASAASCSS